MSEKVSISACIVVYNEESVIERCLQSVRDLVDEIIVVHDGECADQTLTIAKKYTDKIFILPHIGEAEPHRVHALNMAKGEWIFQIDGDEYLDESSIKKIKDLVKSTEYDGYIFAWEMWNGYKAIAFPGNQKMCLFRKNKFHYIGVPHEIGKVEGAVKKVDIFLRHRPSYNNISWKTFWRKKKKWVPVHAKYFFPELVTYEVFNETPDKWIEFARNVRKHPVLYIVFYPFKNLLGQLKNGLWSSRIGINIALQQYVYYLSLYFQVWSFEREMKYGKN